MDETGNLAAEAGAESSDSLIPLIYEDELIIFCSPEDFREIR